MDDRALNSPPTGGDALARIRAIVLSALTIEVALLVVTGVVLFFAYRPSTPRWDVVGASGGAPVLSHGLRVVHRSVSWLAVATAVAAAILHAVGGATTGRRRGTAAIGVGIAITTASAAVTGARLPWDQLALHAVTVGTNMKGYTPVFGDQVVFALQGGSEVSRPTLVGLLVAHVLLVIPVLVGLLVCAWRRHGSTVRTQAADQGASMSSRSTGWARPSSASFRRWAHTE